MRNLTRGVLWLAGAVFFLAAPAHAQLPGPPIELKCPSGYSVLPGHQTFNASTQQFRQYVCVDVNGKIYNQPDDLAGSVVANTFPGSDIFAKANNAAASFSGASGKVIVSPGNYSVTTTLSCLNNITFEVDGVTVSWTGTAGNSAIKIQNVVSCRLHGGMILTSNQTSGTFGLYLGSPTAGSGLTEENEITGLRIGSCNGASNTNGFGVGVMVDGANNAGTYMNTFINVCSSGNLNQGWLFKPALYNHASNNRCISCTADFNGGDGFQVDGANMSTWVGTDAESNSGYGFNMPNTATATFSEVVVGGDFETNTLGDFNFGAGGGSNTGGFFSGFQCASITCQTGFYTNTFGGQFIPGGQGSTSLPGVFSYPQGSILDFPVGAGSGTANPMLWWRDTENSNANIFRIIRNGPGNGQLNIGTPGYPPQIGAPMIVKGTQNITGCSLTTALGGSWGGSFHSGTAGACTVTVTPGITATNGFTCWANDITTAADVVKQTAFTTTTATLSGTTASGDVITWGCTAF